MRFSAVEVLQTSAMDCGPAVVACLLASLGRPIDLAQLRADCQTDLDGTSIDVIEEVLRDYGLQAEQRMLPPARVFEHLPAITVIRLPDGAPHFVTLWRRIGPYVQVMDPARGRYWTRIAQFSPSLLQHRMAAPTDDWRAWAGEAENIAALQNMARGLGLPKDTVQTAVQENGWFPLAALEAAMRLTASLPSAKNPAALCTALVGQTRAAESDVFRLIPPPFWPVVPDPSLRRDEAPRIILQGAVFLSVDTSGAIAQPRPRSRKAPSALAQVFLQNGRLPTVLALGTALAVIGTLAEAYVFRRLFTPAGSLATALGVIGALYLLRLVLGAGILRLGRQIEGQFRLQTFSKLLHLPDRWLSSRPLGDLAERAQSLHITRNAAGLALHLVQSVVEVLALAAGLIYLVPSLALWTLLLAGGALGWPFALRPWLRERDLTLRSLGAAQAGVLMDALRGAAPLRAHRGASALQARFDGLLADWQTTARARAQGAAIGAALGQGIVLALSATMILTQAAPDLLFLWWVMKLPIAAHDLSNVLQQIPAQEALLHRAREPLQSPARALAPLPSTIANAQALAIDLKEAHVLAAGHPVLNGVTLSIAAGEQVAVVGASGSGKSSLLGLLLGWHELAQGQLLISGHNLTAGARNAAAARMVWLDPTARLWGTTVGDNCTNPNLLSRAELNLPAHTPIGAGGVLLSAGEGQRLRLARAMAQQSPALALCDEALRGLEAPRRQRLLTRLRAHWQGRTMIWVTHDLQEAMQFGRVLVMQDGRLAEDGAPDALLAAGGAFAQLYVSQQAMVQRLAENWIEMAVEGFHVHPAE